MDDQDPQKLHQYLSKHLPANMVEEVLRRIQSNDSSREYFSTYDGSSLDSMTRADAINLSKIDTLELPEDLDNQLTQTQHITHDDSSAGTAIQRQKRVSKNILKPGDSVAHFQVSRLIGRGGMGEVYLARDAQLGRKVALKVIRQADVDRDAGLRRFINEARITARFNHPHIVTIYAVGKFDEHLYVALEYLEGQDLSQRMAEEPLSLQESLRVCLAVGEAIEEAHAHGILHRDLKPANILLPKDGRVRVVDFGLAKEVELPTQSDVSDQTLDPQPTSPAGKIVGTPAYMSPEQWRGEDAQPGTDIWALGVTLFELICGHRPYSSAGLFKGGIDVCSSKPVPMPEIIEGLPLRVSQLLQACLEKDLNRRPSAQHFTSVIREIISDHRTPVRESESPFRGLRPFSERHSDLFFGRDDELAKATERLRYEPGLVIVGASGAGKTSFTQAGLIPRLKENQDWLILKLRPGDQPIERLAQRIISTLYQESITGSNMGSQNQSGSMESSESSRVDLYDSEIENLAQKIKQSPKKLHLSLRDLALQKQKKVLLVIDQLEEVFTLCRDSEAQRTFVQCVANAVDESSEPFRIICTIRDDFLGHVARTGDAARGLLEHMMVLDPPDQKALKDVLMLPLLRVGYSFDDPKLADEMVSSLEGGTSLPLLQFAARSLWESRDRVNRLLTRADYDAMGGVEGALARHADGVLDGLTPEELVIAKKLFLRLVTPEETRKTVNEPDLLEGLPDAATDVYERLITSRLLTVSRSAKHQSGTGRLELAHDSLIKTWQTLAQWIEDSKEELIILAEVSQAAELWLRRGKRIEELWTKTGLKDAERLLLHAQSELPSLVVDFIEAGQKRTKQLEQRRRLWTISVPLILICLAGVLTLQKREAEVSREAAEKGRFQAIAQRKVAVNERGIALQKQLESLLESAQSAFAQGGYLESRAKLRSALELSESEPDGFHGLAWQLDSISELWMLLHGSYFYQSAFSWDGKQIASASLDGSIHLTDVDTKARQVLRGHKDQAISLAYSPNDVYLASGGLEKFIRVWDLEKGALKYALPAPKTVIGQIVFSPNSQFLAVKPRSQEIRLWDLDDQSFTDFKREPKSYLHCIFFDTDNQLRRVESNDQSIWIRGIEGRERTYQIKKVSKARHHIAVSANGKRVLLIRPSGNAEIHDLVQGKRIRVIDNVVYRARTSRNRFAINQQGDHVVLLTSKGTLDTFNVASGDLLGSVHMLKREPTRIALSPNGRMIAEPAHNHLRLSRTNIPLKRQNSSTDREAIYALSIDPAGEEIVTTTINNEITIRNGVSGKAEPKPTKMDGGNRNGITHSANGRYLAWVSREQRVHVWDRDLNKLVFSAMGAKGDLSGLTLDSNGKRLVMLTEHELYVWRLGQNKLTFKTTWRDRRETTLAMSHDGKRVLLGFGSTEGQISGWSELWDIERGQLIRRMKRQDDYTIGVAFGPKDEWLITSTWSGSVYRWDRDGRSRQKLLDGSQRINALSLHPSGDRIAMAQSNGIPKIVWLDGGRSVSPIGHIHEVNHVQFSGDGRYLVSGGDDGTIRLWHADTGKPVWNAVSFLNSPARILTHEGWSKLDGSPLKSTDETSKSWATVAAKIGWQAQYNQTAKLSCIVTNDEHLELWNTADDLQIWRKRLPEIREIKTLKNGCLVRDKNKIIRYSLDGRGHPYLLDKPAKTLSMVGDDVLIGTDDTLTRFKDSTPIANYTLSPGITGHLLIPNETSNTHIQHLLVGFQDGSIERYELRGEGLGVPTLIHQRTSAPITHLVGGNRQLLLAGFGDGRVMLMNRSSGRLLDATHLHGAIRFLALDGGTAYAISDLGDAFSWNIETFNSRPCELTRAVWKTIPAVWSLGKARTALVPTSHRCHSP